LAGDTAVRAQTSFIASGWRPGRRAAATQVHPNRHRHVIGSADSASNAPLVQPMPLISHRPSGAHMTPRHLLASLALATLAAQTPAHATDIVLASDGHWATFAVDSFLASGAGLGWIDDAGDPLHFTFVIGSGLSGRLTVLDTGFAGDTFSVLNGAATLGLTSAVPVRQFDPAAAAIEDPDIALADLSFSRAVFTLGSGSYSIGGTLAQSLLSGNEPLDATSGALRLTVGSIAPIPEPSSLALLLAGFGAIGTLARRRLTRR
jgi:hypothetical protein